MGKRNPGGIATKYRMSVDIHDVIKCATFCDDRLRGLVVARGQISRFPIDLRRRPYNTLALPCECVRLYIHQNVDKILVYGFKVITVVVFHLRNKKYIYVRRLFCTVQMSKYFIIVCYL